MLDPSLNMCTARSSSLCVKVTAVVKAVAIVVSCSAGNVFAGDAVSNADSDGPPPLAPSSTSSAGPPPYEDVTDSDSETSSEPPRPWLPTRVVDVDSDLRSIIRENEVQYIDLSTLTDWLYRQSPCLLVRSVDWLPVGLADLMRLAQLRHDSAQAGQATLTQSNWNSIVLRGTFADFMRLHERSTRTMLLGELIPRALLGWAFLGWYHLTYYVD